MSEDESISFPFYITFEDHHSRVLVDELVCCQETFPPKSIDSSNPPSWKCPDRPPANICLAVTTVCKLRSDLTTVPKSLYTKGRNSKDVEYEGLHFTMEMSVLSAALLFELRVDGVR